jgi:hypothetical protein
MTKAGFLSGKKRVLQCKNWLVLSNWFIIHTILMKSKARHNMVGFAIPT